MNKSGSKINGTNEIISIYEIFLLVINNKQVVVTAHKDVTKK